MSPCNRKHVQLLQVVISICNRIMIWGVYEEWNMLHACKPAKLGHWWLLKKGLNVVIGEETLSSPAVARQLLQYRPCRPPWAAHGRRVHRQRATDRVDPGTDRMSWLDVCLHCPRHQQSFRVFPLARGWQQQQQQRTWSSVKSISFLFLRKVNKCESGCRSINIIVHIFLTGE